MKRWSFIESSSKYSEKLQTKNLGLFPDYAGKRRFACGEQPVTNDSGE
jgi:hypothetical protein